MGFSTKVHGPLKWVGALGTLDVTAIRMHQFADALGWACNLWISEREKGFEPSTLALARFLLGQSF
jgi:hypothetical protein